MSKAMRLGLAAIAALVIVIAITRFDLLGQMKHLLAWVADNGVIGAVVFIATYIVATVAFIPGSILTLGAGVVFGVALGSVYVSVAATLGAGLAFLIGRYLARDWVGAKVAGNTKFKAVDDAVAKQGWKIVLLTRLSPVFPFNLLNYAFGLTQVSFRHYFFASWIGMIPGTVMFVYVGSLIGDIAALGSARSERTTGEWVIYGVGLVATILVTVYVTKVARKALQETTDLDGQNPDSKRSTP